VAPVLPLLGPWPLLMVVAAELLPVVVPEEAEGDEEDDTKGLESLEIAAAVRSKSNWRMLSGPC